jgi:hypothetical protein
VSEWVDVEAARLGISRSTFVIRPRSLVSDHGLEAARPGRPFSH